MGQRSAGQARRQGSLLDLRGTLRQDVLTGARPADRPPTSREVEVLCLLAAGCSSDEAAVRLMLSPHTIIRHVTHMMMRSGARSRTELVARAYVAGVLDNGAWPPRPTGQALMRSADSPLPLSLPAGPMT
jgi:DNA-binding CsgD family transcriptional regulator